jgi:glycosyltransferase involved in cell wall biosynthesis
MKLALFTDTYDQINGVANTYRRLADYCVTTGRSLDIYTLASDKTSVEDMGSVRIFRYKPRVPYSYYPGLVFDLLALHPGMIRQCNRRDYDLVHLATPGSIGLNGLVYALLCGKPTIGSYHTALPEYLRMRTGRIPVLRVFGKVSEKVAWKAMELFYNRCAIVLAPSEFTRQSLLKKLKATVDIFSRGIDAEAFNPKHREGSNDVTALYVGRIAVEKNLEVLIDIFRERNDARLMVVGDGPFRMEMERRLERAVFSGFLTGEPLSRAYASADLFVFPSETETFGQVVVEAMSSGLPVVVKDIGGQRELVDDFRDGFVAVDNEDFKRKVDLLIRDGALRLQMGKKARESAARRDWDSVFARLFDIYTEHGRAGAAPKFNRNVTTI